jgi:hypothetical protein
MENKMTQARGGEIPPRDSTKAGITAPQQQRPLHLNQQTLRTHQIIGPVQVFHIPFVCRADEAWPSPQLALAGRLNVRLGEIITTMPVGNQSRTPDEPREPSTRMFRLLDGHVAAFCSFCQHGHFKPNYIVVSMAYTQ